MARCSQRASQLHSLSFLAPRLYSWLTTETIIFAELMCQLVTSPSTQGAQPVYLAVITVLGPSRGSKAQSPWLLMRVTTYCFSQTRVTMSFDASPPIVKSQLWRETGWRAVLTAPRAQLVLMALGASPWTHFSCTCLTPAILTFAESIAPRGMSSLLRVASAARLVGLTDKARPLDSTAPRASP